MPPLAALALAFLVAGCTLSYEEVVGTWRSPDGAELRFMPDGELFLEGFQVDCLETSVMSEQAFWDVTSQSVQVLRVNPDGTAGDYIAELSFGEFGGPQLSNEPCESKEELTQIFTKVNEDET